MDQTGVVTRGLLFSKIESVCSGQYSSYKETLILLYEEFFGVKLCPEPLEDPASSAVRHLGDQQQVLEVYGIGHTTLSSLLTPAYLF